MINLLIGENSFEVGRALNEIIDEFEGYAEKYEGSNLTVSQLPDLLTGTSLFADKRLVIIKNLSENKAVWDKLADWLDNISDDIEVVFCESKPDKRTATFKALKAGCKVIEFNAITDRDKAKIETWTLEEAELAGVKLNKESVQSLVRWVGSDQWALFNALQKLSLVDEVSEAVIQEFTDPNPDESALNLLEVAVSGDKVRLKRMIANLSTSEDVYRLAALLSSQIFQLFVIVTAESNDNPSRDFAIHPFVVSKLKSIVKKLGKPGVSKSIQIMAELDEHLKTSATDPWILLEIALVELAHI